MSRIDVIPINDEQRVKLNIPDRPENIGPWHVWECPVSRFNWEYLEQETAYLYEGQARVKTDLEEVEIKAGELVIFPKGLKCAWNVLEPVIKVYHFD